jgi:sugar O-acyltransferase (sialic acid O-acetyltransferase NeuD family)
VSVKRIVVFGVGENGFQAFHILRHHRDVEVVGFVDDDPARHGSMVLGLPVLGDLSAIPALKQSRGVTGGLVAIGDNAIRARKIAELRGTGLELVSAHHPQTFIDSPEHLGAGTIIEMGVAIHPGARIGDGVFLGGGAIVSHHSTVGDFVLIAGGVVFGGHVNVGAYTLLGVGANIQPHVTIGRNVVVGVGAAVVGDLPDNVVAVGVPAKVIKQRPPIPDAQA